MHLLGSECRLKLGYTSQIFTGVNPDGSLLWLTFNCIHSCHDDLHSLYGTVANCEARWAQRPNVGPRTFDINSYLSDSSTSHSYLLHLASEQLPSVNLIRAMLSVNVHEIREKWIRQSDQMNDCLQKRSENIAGRHHAFAPAVTTLRGRLPPSPPRFRHLCSKLYTCISACACQNTLCTDHLAPHSLTWDSMHQVQLCVYLWQKRLPSTFSLFPGQRFNNLSPMSIRCPVHSGATTSSQACNCSVHWNIQLLTDSYHVSA